MYIELTKFIQSVPPNIRIGQWWVINYGGTGANSCTEITQKLFQLDGQPAIDMITQLMLDYQWDTPPNLRDLP